jgi:hypothetical protein
VVGVVQMLARRIDVLRKIARRIVHVPVIARVRVVSVSQPPELVIPILCLETVRVPAWESLRIVRITRVPAERVCGNVTVGAIWSVAGHRLFLTGRRYENLVLLNVKKYGAQYTKIAIGTFSSRLKN